MKISSYIILTSIALLSMALCGCRQEICYDHAGEMAVNLQWEQEWERDYGKSLSGKWDAATHGVAYEGLKPLAGTSVTMLVYPESDDPYTHFLGSEGGTVNSSPTGSLLFYNDDTECVVINDQASVPDATATTTGRSRSSLMPMHGGERTVNPPDVLYGAYIDRVESAGAHTQQQLSAVMRPLVFSYVITYLIEDGLEYVSLVRGALAGMAESVRLRDGSTPATAATLLFDCELTTTGARAVVHSFGVPSFSGHHYTGAAPSGKTDPSLRFTLNLEVLLKNGKLQSFEFDITDQMRNQPRGGVIVVDGIYVIDEDSQVDSGFEVDVDDWGEYEDVQLPPYET